MLAIKGHLMAKKQLVLLPHQLAVEVPQILIQDLLPNLSQIQAAQELMTIVEVDAPQQEDLVVLLQTPP
jgi:hypothetical protein